MDLLAKIRTIPTEPGVYLYKNAEGEVIYVGKAKNLRSRVASYFHEGRWEDSKTGTLVREAVDVDYIVVANNKEALALENNLIKQRKPRFNILLRDDKTYPYVKLTLGERWPRVYVTRRLRKDGSVYYGPYFPANLAYRIVDLIHRNFLIPSCKVDLTRFHPRPCLQYYIKRCLGPCVKDLTTPDTYQEAVRDVKLFLEGRPTDLSKSLHARMEQAAAAEEYERAARYRDLISTVEQLAGTPAHRRRRRRRRRRLRLSLRKRHAGRKSIPHARRPRGRPPRILLGRPARVRLHPRPRRSIVRDVACYVSGSGNTDAGTPQARAPPAETLRATLSTDRSFNPGEFFSALLKQLYIGQPYVPRNLYVPVDFEDREELEDLLSEQIAGENARAARVHILVPQRGDKRSLIDLAGTNAKQSYDQRFRVLKPNAKAIQEELQEVAQPARTAQAHRVLRHLAHSGRGNRRLDGGVGRRQDEKIRLPQVHHPHRRGCRRFRFHARSGHAPLQTPSGRRRSRCPVSC